MTYEYKLCGHYFDCVQRAEVCQNSYQINWIIGLLSHLSQSIMTHDTKSKNVIRSQDFGWLYGFHVLLLEGLDGREGRGYSRSLLRGAGISLGGI